ncbi:phosphoenolpyruvate carboxykinase (ATP) [Pedobacter alpinus]|uniref:Phosphoenolpyruvate carboxykinase (ATP) n=1 Tax=Pedobacter alpinus TaxID=1590643 RepID=A0ABW5TU34_9SPHI
MKTAKIQLRNFCKLNFSDNVAVHYQLSVPQLVEKALIRKEGLLSESGALAIDTGEFTGRSPKDRFIVEDDVTKDKVWWGDINIKFSPDNFDALFAKVIQYLNTKNELFAREAMAGADENYQIGLNVITEYAFQNLFAHHLFLRPHKNTLFRELERWTIIAAPGFKASPEQDGTRQANFSIINFKKKMILIGGTGYTGEIKKGIFSVLNFLLPQLGVLSMHCSANVGSGGDTAIFFGLSGTGKTTLSADPDRALIGDDEHGWSNNNVFNFEGGCYAKCVNLSQEKEPDIYGAIKFGALLENICFEEGTRNVNFTNISKTENTRVAYPINYIKNALKVSKANAPKNIFFLTADAFGVLPPVSKLTKKQAMFHFISGYTAKVAGTETGINEPKATFSACFGQAFLPLKPKSYAKLLGNKLDEADVNVWLINTGWTGGPYGVGERINLSYSRAIINEVLNGNLNKAKYVKDEIFELNMPTSCNGVPSEILTPKSTWLNPADYDKKAKQLRRDLMINYNKFVENPEEEVAFV